MIDIVKTEADKDLVDSFSDWLEMQLKREKIENINISKIISEKGEHNMLSETLHEILKEREKRGERKGERKGLEKGRLEEKIKVATELLKEGLGEDFIHRVTGLPLKEIKRLKKELGL